MRCLVGTAVYAAQKVLIGAQLNLRLKLVTMVMSDMALFLMCSIAY